MPRMRSNAGMRRAVWVQSRVPKSLSGSVACSAWSSAMPRSTDARTRPYSSIQAAESFTSSFSSVVSMGVMNLHYISTTNHDMTTGDNTRVNKHNMLLDSRPGMTCCMCHPQTFVCQSLPSHARVQHTQSEIYQILATAYSLHEAPVAQRQSI